MDAIKYPTVAAEMARIGMKKGDLAKIMGMQSTTMGYKLCGKSQLTIEEATQIRKALGVQMSIDELFSVFPETCINA